ncbi:MAG: SGNH/GDSL hydrolase family protein [Kiritimatiellia bacterium]
MKRKSRIPLRPLCAVFLAGICAAGCAATPPVYESRFETDPFESGWEWKEASWSRRRPARGSARWVESPDNRGNHCLEVTSGTWRSPAIPVTNRELYRLTFRSTAAGHGHWGAAWYEEKAEDELSGSVYSRVHTTRNWKSTETVVTPTRHTGYCRISFHPFRSEILVDDVTFTPVRREEAIRIMDRIYSDAPALEAKPPEDRWQYLPGARRRLENGRELRLVVMGDSLANDLASSCFHLLVEKNWPGSKVALYKEVQGGGRPHHFLNRETLDNMLRECRPHLVMFGGVSTSRRDIFRLRMIANYVRVQSETEFAAFTGTFLESRYWDDPDKRIIKKRAAYRKELKEAGSRDGFAVFDTGGVWDSYLTACGKKPEYFQRDGIHANDRGKQVFGRIMTLFLSP